MSRLQLICLFFVPLLAPVSYCQETDPGPGYQMVMMNNPSLAGSEGDGTLRLSYLNFYPGNGYNLHSLYLSYDSYFPALHGGASFYLAEDYLGGDVNNVRGGLSYSYFLQAGEDLFFHAGLTGSLYHEGYNFSNSVLPDQIDPLGGVVYPAGETLNSSGQTVFDLGTGFSFISGWLSGGLAVLHLTEPELSSSGIRKDQIKRKLYVHVCGDFPLGKSGKLYSRPITYLSYQGDYLQAGGGLSIENEYLAVNALAMGDNAGNVNLQTGFSLKVGIIRLNYTYRFNVMTGNNLLPVSLLHQTGLAFSLYNVDKRKTFKTINFPKL